METIKERLSLESLVKWLSIALSILISGVILGTRLGAIETEMIDIRKELAEVREDIKTLAPRTIRPPVSAIAGTP